MNRFDRSAEANARYRASFSLRAYLLGVTKEGMMIRLLLLTARHPIECVARLL